MQVGNVSAIAGKHISHLRLTLNLEELGRAVAREAYILRKPRPNMEKPNTLPNGSHGALCVVDATMLKGDNIETMEAAA